MNVKIKDTMNDKINNTMESNTKLPFMESSERPPFSWLKLVDWDDIIKHKLQLVRNPAIWYYSRVHNMWLNEPVNGRGEFVAFITPAETYAVDTRTAFAERYFPCTHNDKFLGKTFTHAKGFKIASRDNGKTVKFIHLRQDGRPRFFDENFDELNPKSLYCTMSPKSERDYERFFSLEAFIDWDRDGFLDDDSLREVTALTALIN